MGSGSRDDLELGVALRRAINPADRLLEPGLLGTKRIFQSVDAVVVLVHRALAHGMRIAVRVLEARASGLGRTGRELLQIDVGDGGLVFVSVKPGPAGASIKMAPV